METVTKERMRELERIKQRLQLGGGGDRLEKQHTSGKLSARERLALLLDRKTFREAGLFAKHNGRLFGMDGKELPADGVVTGRGRVEGRLVHVASQDFTVAGGSAGEVHGNKIADTMKSALKTGSPFIFINDSGGARVQEGIGSLAGYARIFYQNVMLSGSGAADFADLRAVRGRRGLQSGADGFHHSDARCADVHHRSGGDQAGDRRSGRRLRNWAGRAPR